MRRGPLELQSTVDWPPLLAGGAPQSLAYGGSRARGRQPRVGGVAHG
jgi:hypothetical protein